MQAIAAQIGSTRPTLVAPPPPSAPGRGEVLGRTLELGICGTDRDILQSAQPWTPVGEEHLILGHECLGRIEQVGSGVSELSVGDLVVPVVRRANEPGEARPDMLAFGQYTERGIAFEHGFSMPLWLDRPEHLFRVEESLSAVAVLTEPVSVAEKGINESLAVQQGRLGRHIWQEAPPRVLVTGMGPIGFAAVLACRARDWPVTMYGRDASDTFRARLARSFGARYIGADDFDASPADAERDGYDLVLECTGSDEVMLRTCGALASRGVMVWLGSSRDPEPRERNVARLMRIGLLRNHIHIGCVNAAARDFRKAISHLARMHASHRDAVESLITARVGLDDSLEHFARRQPQSVKVVVVYGD